MPFNDIVGRWVRLEDINDWMEDMVHLHGFSGTGSRKGKRKAEMFYSGRSHEGRTLKGIKIGRGHEVRH